MILMFIHNNVRQAWTPTTLSIYAIQSRAYLREDASGGITGENETLDC
jgi:hypothetical protein